MRRLAVLAQCVVSILLVGCARSEPPNPLAKLHDTLQAAVEATVSGHEEVPAAALCVTAPAIGLAWQGAAGLADPAHGVQMTADTPVLIASNTKTFIAASVLRLVEQGRIGLDDPIEQHLLPATSELLRSDGYDTAAITVRHLLTHTSGLFDYADRSVYPDKILADPLHRWSRREQLEGAVEWGDPLGAPGEVFSYADTNYVLLGEILEQITGQTMWDAVRELVNYRALGLTSTWFESLEPRPAGVPALAHQYYGEVDSTTIDPSCDLYGGGGLASTVGDLARFVRGLFDGSIYSKPTTSELMMTTVPGARLPDGDPGHGLAPGAYRMGMWVADQAGYTTYRHSGFWGTDVIWVPALDLAVAATVNQNQAREASKELIDRVITAVAAESKR